MSASATYCVQRYRQNLSYSVREVSHNTVLSSRILFSDHEKVIEFYPHFEKLSIAEIDDALLRAGSTLSVDQSNWVTDRFECDVEFGEKLHVFRSKRCGRAAVVDVSYSKRTGFGSGPIFNVKGCGTLPGRVPKAEFNHNNGLLFLNEAIVEYFYYILVDVLKNEVGFDALPHFGIVDLGISVEIAHLPPIPAVALIRAPHFRASDETDLPRLNDQAIDTMIEAELALNQVGLSSSQLGYQFMLAGDEASMCFYDWVQPFESDLIKKFMQEFCIASPFKSFSPNIQFCDVDRWSDGSKCLVDFGHFKMFRDEVGAAGVIRSHDGPMNWGKEFRYQSDPHRNSTAISSYLGKASGPNNENEKMYEWVYSYHPPSEFLSKTEEWAMLLTYKYIHGMLDGNAIREAIVDRVEACSAVMAAPNLAKFN